MTALLEGGAGTMTAAVLHGREDVRMEAVAVPAAGPGEVRVRIAVALTCGTDLKVYRRGYHARMIVPPAVFGHEFAGTVDAVGEGVTGWRPGDRVVAANSAPCDACFFCEREQPELCEDLLFLNGAYAEFVTVPERIVLKNLLRIPDTLKDEAAALVEPLACAVHAMEETGIEAGEDLAVLGAGPLGLMLIRLGVLRGARVFSIASRAPRIEAARRMGAEAVLDVRSNEDPVEWIRARSRSGRGADRVIEAVGTTDAWDQALRLVRPGGVVNLFGGCASGTAVSIDTARIHYDALSIRGTFHHTPASVRTALHHLEAGDVPHAPLLEEQIALEELPVLFSRMALGGGPLKTMVYPDGQHVEAPAG